MKAKGHVEKRPLSLSDDEQQSRSTVTARLQHQGARRLSAIAELDCEAATYGAGD